MKIEVAGFPVPPFALVGCQLAWIGKRDKILLPFDPPWKRSVYGSTKKPKSLFIFRPLDITPQRSFLFVSLNISSPSGGVCSVYFQLFILLLFFFFIKCLFLSNILFLDLGRCITEEKSDQMIGYRTEETEVFCILEILKGRLINRVTKMSFF